MPLSRTHRAGRTPQRRRTAWARQASNNLALVANVAQRIDVLASFKTARTDTTLEGCTVLRSHLWIVFTGTAIVGGIARAGLLVEDLLSLPAAATNGPITRPDRDWYGLVTQTVVGSAALTAVNYNNGRLWDYDFKSRRKLEEVNSSAFVYVESPSNVAVSFQTDILLALP